MILNKRAPLFRAVLSIQNHRASITSRRSNNYNLYRVVSPLLPVPHTASSPPLPFSYLSTILRTRPRRALTPVDPSTGPKLLEQHPTLAFSFALVFARQHSSFLIHLSRHPRANLSRSFAPPSVSDPLRVSRRGYEGGEKTEAHVYRLMVKIVQ